MKKNILRSNIVTLFLLCTLLSSCYLTNVQGLIRSDREKSSNTTIKKNSNSKIRFRKIAGRGFIIGGTLLLTSLGIFFYLKKQAILGNRKISALPSNKRNEVASTISTHNANQEVVGDDQNNDSKDNSNGDPPENQLTEKVKNVELENPIKNSKKLKTNKKEFCKESNDHDFEDNHENESENKQEKERVKKLKERLKKEGKKIAKNFPYRFEDYLITDYNLDGYHRKNVAPNGNCWLYTSWVAYFHILNHCKEAYENFPKIMKKLRSDVMGYKKRYEEWGDHLRQAREQLNNPSQQKQYLVTYRLVVAYYLAIFKYHKSLFKKEMKEFEFEKEKMSDNAREMSKESIYGTLVDRLATSAPYQVRYTSFKYGGLYKKTIYEKDKTLYKLAFEVEEKEKASTSRVCNLMKRPWMEHISWLPDMHELYTLGYQDGVDILKSTVKKIDEQLNKKGDENAITYIRERVVGRYLKEVEKIIGYCQEFIDMIPLLIHLLREAHQYAASLKEQLEWLQRNPEKLALLLRVGRLTKFIFDNIPNNADISKYHKQFYDDLIDGTYGRIKVDFQRFGLNLRDKEIKEFFDKEGKLDKYDKIESILYTKGEEVKVVEGLLSITRNYKKKEYKYLNHTYYAVTQQVWEGK